MSGMNTQLLEWIPHMVFLQSASRWGAHLGAKPIQEQNRNHWSSDYAEVAKSFEVA